MSSHPSRADLTAWVSGDLQRIEPHIESCRTCQLDLDEMTALNPRAAQALERFTSPRSGMLDRLGESLLERRERGAGWEVMLDLFGVGWSTVDLMLEDQDDD